MTQVKITFLTIINILISTKRRIKSVLRPLQKWTEDDLAPLQEICSIRVLFISYGATGTRFMRGYKSRLWLYITCERWQGWSHIMRVRVVTSEELPCVPVFLYPPNLTFYLLVSGEYSRVQSILLNFCGRGRRVMHKNCLPKVNRC